MTIFLDIYLPSGLPVDRDDIEDVLASIDGIDVVGAGSGEGGQNIDLEFDESVPVEDVLSAIAVALSRLGVSNGAYIRRSDTGARIDVEDIEV